jgi:CRISPR/Cas system CSM-associated protein Csm3 (group 7 of RAMP superfamily)
MTKQHEARVNGKIYFTGNLVFTDSFVTVSSGIGDERTDSMLTRDSDCQLIIPATSFAGVLRQELETLFKDEKEELDCLFGNNNKEKEDEQKCSDFVFNDLYAAEQENETGTHVQQGVCISRHYLSAEDKGKFDREIALNHTFTFYFYLEKTKKEPEYYHKWTKRLAVVLNSERTFFIGGRNSVGNGWGKFENVKYLDYDFTNPDQLKKYLMRTGIEKDFVENLMNNGNPSLPELGIKPTEKHYIKLDYTIKFKDAFLINDPDAEPTDDHEAEFNFLKINGKYTIPGSSVKGIFRSRSEMISKTVGIAEGKIEKIFGKTDEKSKIYFSYAFPDNNKANEFSEKLMDGVSIDRFTGGAAEAALFDFNVLMNGTFHGQTIIELSEETFWYLPLLYLVIRDIREGDLSFGFGRTKGWGKAASFDFKIKGKNLPDEWEKYVKGQDLNIDELENLYKNVLDQEKTNG